MADSKRKGYRHRRLILEQGTTRLRDSPDCDTRDHGRAGWEVERSIYTAMLRSHKVQQMELRLVVGRRLGHSKASITLDVYGHLMGGADEAAAKAMEGVLK
jgi:hypothetical protein